MALPASEIVARLAALGYTDLAAETRKGTFTLYFANQSYWRLASAVGEILSVLADSLSDESSIRLVPLHARVPIGLLELSLADYSAWRSRVLSDAQLADRITVSRCEQPVLTLTHSAQGWLDISVTPGYGLNRGFSLGLQERASLGLDHGIRLDLALQHTFAGPTLSPVPAAGLTYFRWLLPTVISSTRIGYFSAGGWGGQTEVGLPIGAVDVRLVGGWASDASPEALARVYWRPGWLDLTLRGGIGRYVSGDWGYETGVIRRFTRSSLEGTILYTSNGVDLRAVLTINLGGARRPPARPFRFELGTWDAVYQPDGERIGRTLATPDTLDVFRDAMFLDELATMMPTWSRD